MLAKDSASLIEMYKNSAYEGHPLLWNALLFIITRFTADVFFMQLLNIIIMSGCVYLFLKYAPFKKIFSILIVFSYFFIFEYHVISRNYAVSLFFLILVFILISKPSKNHYLTAFFLLLLSLTHLYSVIISSVLCVLLIFIHKNDKIKNIYLLLFFVNILIVYSLRVPSDHFLFKYDNDAFLSFKRVGKAFSVYLKGFLPLPDVTAEKVWNSNIIVSFSKTAATILSVIFLFIPVLLFKKYKIVLFFFYLSSLSICFFIYFSPMMVSARHCGFIFLILIFSFWLQKIVYPSFSLKNILRERVAVIFLLLHCFSGFYLIAEDFRRNFSNSKELAGFIKKNKLENRQIFLSNLSSGPPVSAYLNKKITYLETEHKDSFCKWNTWPFVINSGQICSALNRQINGDTALLIINKSHLKENLGGEIETKLSDFNVVKLASFEGAMLPSENYDLYYISKKRVAEH